MVLVLNPKVDGNCSFGCISKAIYDDKNILMRMKDEMREWYKDNKDRICKNLIFEHEIGPTLNNTDSEPSSEFWFDSNDCLQIVADAYDRAAAVYSEAAADVLYHPLRSSLPKNKKPIMLYLSQTIMRHWYPIEFDRNEFKKFKWPSINVYYEHRYISLGLTNNTHLFK
ncbi:unnamed protein product [Rhizopus stolonifer]